MDLAEQVKKSREKFSDRLGRDLEAKHRATDVRRVFTHTVRSRYSTLTVLWIGKHNRLAKVLLESYSPEQLHEMIERYVGTPEYHMHHGLSFDGFYWSTARIASDMAREAEQAAVRARHERRQAEYLAQQNISPVPPAIPSTETPPPPQSPALEQFKQSAFFRKLPKLFQEKLGG